jgi:hypothetical protein
VNVHVVEALGASPGSTICVPSRPNAARVCGPKETAEPPAVVHETVTEMLEHRSMGTPLSNWFTQAPGVRVRLEAAWLPALRSCTVVVRVSPFGLIGGEFGLPFWP